MWHRNIKNLGSTTEETIGEVEMNSTKSDDVLQMESLLNSSSERFFWTNQIWEKSFPE